MEDNILVSVIILTYNKFQYFKDCIDSVLNQNYKNIEIIISDDGSKNYDRDYLSNYILNSKKNISNFIINHNEENVGTVKNFNIAIKLSKGKYIVPLALDDILYDSNTIGDIVKYFEKTKCLILTAYREIYDEEMKKMLTKLPQEKVIRALESKNNQLIYKKLCKGNFISGACTPFSRDFIKNYGYFDEEYILLEDYPKYLNVIRQGCQINFYRRCTIKYRLGGISENVSPNTLIARDNEIAIRKEILPYKNISGSFMHRFNAYKIRENEIKTQNKKISMIKLYFKYIDILFYNYIRNCSVTLRKILKL